MNYRSRLVGVFGFPVDENPSVVMNEAAFKAAGLDWRYLTVKVEPKDLPAAMAGLRAMNFDGINLTIPHKMAVMEHIDDMSAAARLIGSVNIVVNRAGRLWGDNTDGKGMVHSLQEAGVPLKGRRLVVLGAGGAARAICVEAALAGCATVEILARTLGKAQAIKEILNRHTQAKATAQLWQGTAPIPACDILINATPVGLFPDASSPDIWYGDITPDMFVQDVIPNPANTPFLARARERGARTGDGLGMLVAQGAIGFALWTGQKAPVEAMAQSLRQEFGGGA